MANCNLNKLAQLAEGALAKLVITHWQHHYCTLSLTLKSSLYRPNETFSLRRQPATLWANF